MDARYGYANVWGVPAQGGYVRLNDADAATLVDKTSQLATATTHRLEAVARTAGKVALVGAGVGLAGLAVLGIASMLGAIASSNRTSYGGLGGSRDDRSRGERERDELWANDKPRTTLSRFCTLRTPQRFAHGVCITPFIETMNGGRVLIPTSKIVYLGSTRETIFMITDDHEYYESPLAGLVTRSLRFATTVGLQDVNLPEPPVRIMNGRPTVPSPNIYRPPTGDPGSLGHKLGPLQFLGVTEVDLPTLQSGLGVSLERQHPHLRQILTDPGFGQYYARLTG